MFCLVLVSVRAYLAFACSVFLTVRCDLDDGLLEPSPSDAEPVARMTNARVLPPVTRTRLVYVHFFLFRRRN